jgi:serine/threonine-protein kinase
MIGAQIGTFRFIEQIGEGGMGVVYRGVDTGLDRQVAIKVLRPELTYDHELVERFRDEAKAQANLNHANIATLYAFVHTEGYCLIVMEFIEGNTFETLLANRGRLPWRGAVSLTKQALQGLGFAHARGVVHRDIKPANLMLTNSGIVKVMDFGIVKALGHVKTRTGTQMGTPRYMSPEQIRGAHVDARSDIYSVGVTLYELLTGDSPFHGDSDYDLMSAHIHTPPPSFSGHHGDIPANVEQVVMTALAKDPASRFQTAEDFGAALVTATESAPKKQEVASQASTTGASTKGGSTTESGGSIAVNSDQGGSPRKTKPIGRDAEKVAPVEHGKVEGDKTARGATSILSGWWRSFRVLITPGKVFAELREHTTWWAPLLLVALADAAWVYELRSIFPTYRLGQPFLIPLLGQWMYALPGLNLLFASLLAGILFVLLRKKAVDLKFGATFAVTLYSRIPLILETILSGLTNGRILPLMGQRYSPLVDFSVRYLPVNDRAYFAWALFAPNIFTLWSMLLLSVGLSRVSQLKRWTATWAVVGIYALDAVINAAVLWKHWT